MNATPSEKAETSAPETDSNLAAVSEVGYVPLTEADLQAFRVGADPTASALDIPIAAPELPREPVAPPPAAPAPAQPTPGVLAPVVPTPPGR